MFELLNQLAKLVAGMVKRGGKRPPPAKPPPERGDDEVDREIDDAIKRGDV